MTVTTALSVAQSLVTTIDLPVHGLTVTEDEVYMQVPTWTGEETERVEIVRQWAAQMDTQVEVRGFTVRAERLIDGMWVTVWTEIAARQAGAA